MFISKTKFKSSLEFMVFLPAGNGSVDHQTSRMDAKHAPNTPSVEKPIMPKPPSLPTFATHPLPKFTDTQSLEREVAPQTPVSSTPASTTPQHSSTPLARLPTMSLIKFESSPPPVTQTTSVSYGHLQRPISVAFGAMPHQILTPAQLQVMNSLHSNLIFDLGWKMQPHCERADSKGKNTKFVCEML